LHTTGKVAQRDVRWITLRPAGVTTVRDVTLANLKRAT
jgi:hypothetical protein